MTVTGWPRAASTILAGALASLVLGVLNVSIAQGAPLKAAADARMMRLHEREAECGKPHALLYAACGVSAGSLRL